MKISELIYKTDRPFYSLEFFPPKDEAHMPDFFNAAQKLEAMAPLFVSVTYGAGGSRQANTLEVAAILKRNCGYEPMTHLTCVSSHREKIKDYLAGLRKERIDNILALRGDAPKPGTFGEHPYDWNSGDFKHASDLVKFIRAGFPDFCIGVAAYPAPHPESESYEADRLHTAQKVKDGGDFLVTQLFFDKNEYISLVKDLRAQGVQKPVIPGIMPVQSFDSLKFVMSLCGANISKDYYAEIEEAHNSGIPGAVREIGTRFAAAQVRELLDAGAPGVHLYTLNKSEICLKIAKLVGRL